MKQREEKNELASTWTVAGNGVATQRVSHAGCINWKKDDGWPSVSQTKQERYARSHCKGLLDLGFNIYIDRCGKSRQNVETSSAQWANRAGRDTQNPMRLRWASHSHVRALRRWTHRQAPEGSRGLRSRRPLQAVCECCSLDAFHKWRHHFELRTLPHARS